MKLTATGRLAHVEGERGGGAVRSPGTWFPADGMGTLP
jgi:hypothetical protein